jgi:hypothetical protein
MVTVSNAALQWLKDAPALSAEILAALQTPPPTIEAGMDYPQTESDLRALLQSYASNNVVGMLDPRTNVTVSNTLVVSQTTNSGKPWGVNGNFATIKYAGPAGHDLLKVVGSPSNRGLTIQNLTLDGGDPNLNGQGALACLRLSAPQGDAAPLYKFTVENVFTMEAAYGFVLEGGVYEGALINCQAENHSKDGCMMQHMNLGQPGQAIVSNILMVGPNMSRNLGAGIRPVYSVNIIGGSFVLNGDGGVHAADGCRVIAYCNGENTAGPEQAAFVVPSNGYGSVVDTCEASSDGMTYCRKWNGTAWVDVGSPMLYLLSAGTGVSQQQNHVSYYGPPPDPMRVVK